MVSVRAQRHVTAEAASVALLLADPSVTAPAVSAVRSAVTPPRRSGVGFISSVDTFGGGDLTANGLVTITPADNGCDVSLVLYARDDDSTRGLSRWAGGFLAELAGRAQARSFAA